MIIRNDTSPHGAAAKLSTNDLTLTGARLVLADEVYDGTVHIIDGYIDDIAAGRSTVPGAIDLEGGYLTPGLIDLHTDNSERHALPRAGVVWNHLSAIMAHDALVIAAGITTVFDSLCIGSTTRDHTRQADRARILPVLIDGIREARDHELLRADHFLHLRCEVTDEEVMSGFTPLVGDPLVKLVSVMDHAPGHRQSPQLERFREMQISQHGWLAEDADRRIEAWIDASRTIGPQNRSRIIALARARQLPLASHDDETPEHVREANDAGVLISEFPTTRAAAEMARSLGICILMGAPNVVRGSSHSGNISARELATTGHLDILASDYVPASLLHGAFQLTKDPIGMSLAKAISTVSSVPASVTGLCDRGMIGIGARADLCHIVEISNIPVVRGVWRQGRQVF